MIALLLSSNPSLQQMAASVLGGIREEEAIEPLAALLSSEDPGTRIAGIEALAEIDTFQCRSHIEKCLTDPSDRVRDNADYWWNELGGQTHRRVAARGR